MELKWIHGVELVASIVAGLVGGFLFRLPYVSRFLDQRSKTKLDEQDRAFMMVRKAHNRAIKILEKSSNRLESKLVEAIGKLEMAEQLHSECDEKLKRLGSALQLHNKHQDAQIESLQEQVKGVSDDDHGNKN
jgi:hypothetical protein